MEYGPSEMSYRLNPAGIAFMLPVYMLSATWIANEDYGLEALGDLFIPPYGPDWIAVRALAQGFDSGDSQGSESVALSAQAYRAFVAELSEDEKQLIGDWIAFFATVIYPCYVAKPHLPAITRFWKEGVDELS